MARLDIGRPFFLPPGVPVDRVAALRKAFDETMHDPAYLAEAKKLKIDVDPSTGEELAALIGLVSHTPSDVVARVRKVLASR
jgi:tripartite-type tricarboxylate transporter receptor subunit TctC